MAHDPGINALNGQYEPSPNERIRNQVAEYEASAGSRADTLEGYPVVILTTVGVRSGKVRKNPIMRIVDGDRYVAIASAAGRPEHPVWYRNIVAHPIVRVQDGPTARTYQAQEMHGDQTHRYWELADNAFPKFAEYRQRAGRDIPIIVLDPITDDDLR
jgi:deazaflavin-dependent oxidoreductase (nitroreductase family)